MIPGMNIQLVEKLIEDQPLLSKMLQDGTITPEAVEQSYYMAKFEELDKVHSNQIFQVEVPKTGKKQWRTYVGVGKSRRLISDGSKYKLKIKLLEYYGITDEPKLTVEDCWKQYILQHPSVVNSPNSTLRAKQVYSQHLEGSSILKRPIATIKKAELELFCNQLIKDHELTKESWGNVKAILNGIFDAAIDKEEISRNIVKQVKIKVKFAQSNKRPKENLYFTTDQLAHLRRWLYQEYEATGNIACIAILIQAVTGMRVGELGALAWNDILASSMHIHRELVLDQGSYEYHIVEHTKGYDNRFIPLHPKVKTYLEMLKDRYPVNSEIVFKKEHGGFLTTRDINRTLERYARDNNLHVKRSHCLRRTYATLLYLGGVDKETIRQYLGHREIATTERYICAARDTDESLNILSRVL